jgi:hypothetical protein
MQTYTGGAYWPLDPRPEEVRIEDIAAALSKLCRYGGHTIRFYSVAEHSVLVASKAPAGLQLAALMHDAPESYVTDLIRPIKYNVTGYKEIEQINERCIAERFGLPYPMPSEIKALDERIITDEKTQVMGPSPFSWKQDKHHDTNVPALGVTLHFWTPAQAAYEFTTAFYLYGGKS